jgi:hypothetical protein
VEQLTLAEMLSSSPPAVPLPEPTRRALIAGMAEMILTVVGVRQSEDGPVSPKEVSRDD